ncbi:MAG: GGDEF domain-containing protein [Chloroflexi bacterium]|nr:GGDEF domain-containing protein [Chloroflexota bacterium]
MILITEVSEKNYKNVKKQYTKIDYFSKIGQTRAVILVSLLAWIPAVLLTLLFVFILRIVGIETNPIAAIIIASSVEILLTPTLSSHLIGQALKIHQLEIEMRDFATYDSLTGLLCRRVFSEQVKYCSKIAKREGSSFSIAIMDLDNFKKINDIYGHAVGDQTLVSYSDIAKRTCRESDLVCRFGGDEFIFFLPYTSIKQAVNFGERFVAALDEEVEHWDLPIHYTVSIGLAAYPESGIENLEEIIIAADNALYQAKQLGGNQIQIFIEEPE